MRQLNFLVLFLFLASSISSTKGQNIAKGKKYVFSEKPNYYLTDGNDNIDLTDGKKKSGIRFWQHKSTVGWNHIDEVRIDLDLGGLYNIDEISINTARRQAAKVEYPLNCLIFTSLDNENFEFHGDLMLSSHNNSGDYKVEEFNLSNIKATGRFVKLVLKPKGKYLFLDELEVTGTKVINNQYIAKQLIRKSNLDHFIKDAVNESLEKRNDRRHVESAKGYLGGFAPEGKVFSSTEDVKNIIAVAQNEFLPKEVVVTPISSIGDLKNFNLNDVVENLKKANKNFSEDHYGLQFFSLINNKPMDERVFFETNNELFGSVYEILPVVSQSNVNIKDALQIIENNTIKLRSGENRYFVFNTFSGNNRKSDLRILNSEKDSLLAAFHIDNSWKNNTRQFKKLDVNVWAYLDKPVIKKNIEFVVDDLEKAGVNVIVVQYWFIDGYDTKDFSKLKQYLKNFKNLQDKKILLFFNFKSKPEEKFNGKVFMDKTWRRNFEKWYLLLQEELVKIGVNHQEIYFYPYDEIKSTEVDNFVNLARWGKAVIPNFKTFVTINDENVFRASKSADIVQVSSNYLTSLGRLGAQDVWFYEVLNQSRDRDPYKDYRLMAWNAYYYDLSGLGFWDYSALQSPDDAYYFKIIDGNNEYSVIYLNEDNEVLLSLRWLSFQQGLKDFQMLQYYGTILGKDEVKKIVKSVIDNPDNYNGANDALREMSSR